ncbi:MAG: hypothetical protein SNJ71_00110 [Bacteroidales bacterium]
MKVFIFLLKVLLAVIVTPIHIFAPWYSPILGALDVEIWKNWIVDELFKNNQFLNYARSADEYVLQGKVVHIPQSGVASGVEENRSSLPATVSDRSDTDIVYVLDEFTSNPRLIKDADKILSYDKMSSCMGQDMNSLKQLVADKMLYLWAKDATAGMITRTTGATGAEAHTEGATGLRKVITTNDILKLATMFDVKNIPDADRYIMLDAIMYSQFVGQLSDVQYREFSRVLDVEKGIVGEMYGFQFLKRSTVLTATNAAIPDVKNINATGAATDNACAIAWHSFWVERAIGEVTIFESTNNPLYYGDIYSLLVRAGGRRLRADNKGVALLIQQPHS